MTNSNPGQTQLDGVSIRIPVGGTDDRLRTVGAQALLPYPQYCGNIYGQNETSALHVTLPADQGRDGSRTAVDARIHTFSKTSLTLRARKVRPLVGVA